MSNGARLDWQKARRRLEEAQNALQHSGQLSESELNRVYRERADRFSQPLPHTGQSGSESLLVFRFGESRFGIPLASVAEVSAHPKIAPVPGAPPEIAGLIQVRGEVRPVWDLRPTLNLASAADFDWNAAQIILLRNGAHEIGILVDRVEDVVSLDRHLQTPASTVGLPGSWVTEDFTTVLNAKSIFDRFQDPKPL
jgi:purine-binding chemotaxis protein CheW